MLLAILLLCSAPLRAEWDYSSDNTLMGVHRQFPNGASRLNDISEGQLESLTGARYMNGAFQFEAKALLRSIQSPINKYANDFAFADLTPPRRLMKLYAPIGGEGEENQTMLDAGSLWASYNTESWQFSGGRRAMGIGVLKVIPVWNRLYPVLPTASGYMFINNPDIFDVRWNQGQWTIASYSIFSQYYDDSISAVELINYGDKVENHFLLSRWWNQNTAGYSTVVDSSFGIFRLESLLVAKEDKSKGGFQVGLGWEKAFTEKFSLLAEYYHSTYGAQDFDDYLALTPTPFRALLASDYIYPQMTYKFTDFYSQNLGFLTNMIDQSFMLIAESTYSYSDNTDFFVTLRCPFGSEGKEFGHISVPITSEKLEYGRWLSVGLKMNL